MATNYDNQAPAYHGIRNAKYAVRGEDGAPGVSTVPFKYAKSVGFDAAVDQQPVYMNDMKVLTLVTDQGYTGTIGTSAQDRALEKALGHLVEVDGMLADVKQNGFVRFDFYYEYVEHTASGIPYIVKVWALNMEAAKASKAHSTDTNTATLGEYSYPITVYGDPVKTSDGAETYHDANGNEIIGVRAISVPSDAGYQTFGNSVPKMKMKAVPAE